jgi:hypothetical protein
MMSYWSEFAAYGAPGRGRKGELPLWPAWDESTPESERLVVFDSEAGGGIRMSADAVTSTNLVARMRDDTRFAGAEERCAFLAQLQAWRPLPAADVALAGCAADADVAASR